MPVEIEEIVIRAKISEAKTDHKMNSDSPSARLKLIQSCVAEVLRVIESKKRP